jgi:hypothetical protein
MSDITVIQRTQRITVDPASNSVSVTNTGPMGPRGLTGTGIVDSIVAGENITVDATDANNPIVSVDVDFDAPPTAHAASHQNGGDDEIALDASQITTGSIADARIPSKITRDTELASGLSGKANTAHTHPQSDVTGLVAALGLKANSSALGTAAAASITDFDASGAAATALAAANDYTDAAILDVEIAGGGVVDSIVAGPGITINNTDPSNPIVTAVGGGGGGGPSWELQRYYVVDEPRVDADHVIWYPDDPALDDPTMSLADMDLLFRDDPSGGGGGSSYDAVAAMLVEGANITLTLDGVDDEITISATGLLESVVAGTGITIDATDPANPIISNTGGGGTVDATSVAAAGALMRTGGTMTGDIVVGSGSSLVSVSSGLIPISVPGTGGQINLITNGFTRLRVEDGAITIFSVPLVLGVDATAAMQAVTLQQLQASYQLKAPGQQYQTGTSYTPVLADASKTLLLDNASPFTLTVPPNSSVPYPNDTSMNIVQNGAGQVTVAPGSGVTIRKAMPTAKTRAQYSVMTLIKLGTDDWLLTGDAAAT